MLEIKNLFYRYKKSLPDVLNGVDCVFHSGKLYCITGKSGSGKTTLISLLARLEIPTSGEIVFNGRNIKKLNCYKYRSSQVGIIFQSYNLIFKQTALENVIMALYLSGDKRPDANTASALLDGVGISGASQKRTILHLSGGEQQRVAIARALAGSPEIIIADEPTGNLDSENSETIVGILKRAAKEEGKCVIIVTHNEKVAEAADVVYNLKDGKFA